HRVKPHLACPAQFAKNYQVGNWLAQIDLIAHVGPLARSSVAPVFRFGRDQFAPRFVLVGFAIGKPIPTQPLAGFALTDHTQARASTRVAAVGLDLAGFDPAFNHVTAVLQPNSGTPRSRAGLLSADSQGGGRVGPLEGGLAGDR